MVGVVRLVPFAEDPQGSAGTTVADGVCAKIGRRDYQLYSQGLHGIVYAVDHFLTGATIEHPLARGHDLTPAASTLSGETIIIFADVDPRHHCSVAAQVYIRDIVEADAAAASGPRYGPRLACAAGLWKARCAEDRHRGLFELAARTLDDADLARLRGLEHRVPITAIVGDSRATGRTGGRFFAAVVPLPGYRFGADPTADR